ncbi:hypothetical protein SmJEL517_g02565 [Synchytrium microbalum]|uniref:J domain-containing protein n=1 Tax=Synchytrium microbalum TaxID=1806994 RepID=A0A507CBI4_9FUNG|nr:uncharacterized protein SmJEL517_g02565 [Synchytrium microbalum]TPX34903.1 hypothetical protein SmJEL517_g02565 [Synchytrium microbalum]
MTKTDYYELLGVDIRASADDIKKGYRRKALELHPDKNIGRVEEATRLFSEVREAYDVLSDDHERAWYDSHKDEILRGDDIGDADSDGEYAPPASAGTTTEALMKYFSNSCYKNFDPTSPASFYTVYHELFARLESEEIEALRSDSEARRENGYQFDDHLDFLGSDVVQFYKTWTNFSTVKSFRWKDKWRLSEAPDRRVRRAMEAENKQERDKARKEFMDTVRQLAEYVRKRDPRYKAHLEASRAAQEVKDREATKKRNDERRERLKDAMKYETPDWAKAEIEVDEDGSVRVKQRRNGDDNDDDVDESDDAEPDQLDDVDEEGLLDFYCVACDKEFKSAKQLHNHEKSKRHQKMEFMLKKQMRKEAAATGDDIDLIDVDDDDDVFVDAPDEPVSPDKVEAEDDPVKDDDEDMPIEPIPTNNNSKAKSKKSKKKQRGFGAEADFTGVVSDTDSNVQSNTKKSKKASKRQQQKQQGSSSAPVIDSDTVNEPATVTSRTREDIEDDDEGDDMEEPIDEEADANGTDDGLEELGSRFASKTSLSKVEEEEDVDEETIASNPQLDTESVASSGPSKPKSKAKAKKAARNAAAASSSAAPTTTSSNSLICEVCREVFNTRNKLFDHIKATGHALAPGGGSAGAKKQKGKRK